MVQLVNIKNVFKHQILPILFPVPNVFNYTGIPSPANLNNDIFKNKTRKFFVKNLSLNCKGSIK